VHRRRNVQAPRRTPGSESTPNRFRVRSESVQSEAMTRLNLPGRMDRRKCTLHNRPVHTWRLWPTHAGLASAVRGARIAMRLALERRASSDRRMALGLPRVRSDRHTPSRTATVRDNSLVPIANA
jgi:hypothetical protein